MPLPLYYDSLDTARRQDDVMLWRSSFKENIRCKNAIEKALAENFDGMHLKDGIIPPKFSSCRGIRHRPSHMGTCQHGKGTHGRRQIPPRKQGVG